MTIFLTKIAYLWFNCNCWDVASRVRIIELAWQFLPNGSRPVHRSNIDIHRPSGSTNRNWLSFPFVLVHHVRQKSSPRESHSFWVRIKAFIPNTLVNISWDRSRFAITAPCWGRSIIIEITAKNIYFILSAGSKRDEDQVLILRWKLQTRHMINK